VILKYGTETSTKHDGISSQIQVSKSNVMLFFYFLQPKPGLVLGKEVTKEVYTDIPVL